MRAALLTPALLLLVACVETPSDVAIETVTTGPARTAGATPQGRVVEISEAVQRIARPGQNLETVRLFSDGCYWWLYSGPVEDTYIPLQTRDDRPICARGQGITIEDYESQGS